MTAEVAIMNRSAVALAADSTVTIGDGDKTYSVNKLFTLSKLHPVGVMIYGDASFMQIPWETLIKQYRRQLGERSFEHVRDYAIDIMRYLEGLGDIFTDDLQKEHIEIISGGVAGAIGNDIDKAVKGRLAAGQPTTDSDIGQIAHDEIKEWQEYAEREPRLPCIDADFVQKFRDRYHEVIENSIKNELGVKSDFFERFENYRDEEHIGPLIDVIGALPKDELALIAEALVNLTSVKRKVSSGRETVGGPIDVAVISKGDGFVWINRKHYFRPELNPHFMETYFRR